MRIRNNKGRWTSEEHDAFLRGVEMYGRNNLEAVASLVPTRTILQIRTHSQKYFTKIDRGEVFPEEPYPSQYEPSAGKAGAAAGAFLYDLPQHEEQEGDRLQLEDGDDGFIDRMDMGPPLVFVQQGLGGRGGGGGGSGGTEFGRRYPGLMIGLEQQAATAAGSTERTNSAGTAAAAADVGRRPAIQSPPVAPIRLVLLTVPVTGSTASGAAPPNPGRPCFACQTTTTTTTTATTTKTTTGRTTTPIWRHFRPSPRRGPAHPRRRLPGAPAPDVPSTSPRAQIPLTWPQALLPALPGAVAFGKPVVASNTTVVFSRTMSVCSQSGDVSSKAGAASSRAVVAVTSTVVGVVTNGAASAAAVAATPTSTAVAMAVTAGRSTSMPRPRGKTSTVKWRVRNSSSLGGVRGATSTNGRLNRCLKVSIPAKAGRTYRWGMAVARRTGHTRTSSSTALRSEMSIHSVNCNCNLMPSVKRISHPMELPFCVVLFL
ncbi:unnamed protein product [Pylaiella littoralis]